ncbi:MAG: hypothetical protein L0271_26940 [Gemmatimonadetes bacterium]|nr:hypothetical protein [Gemmatimonadota bacterium]
MKRSLVVPALVLATFAACEQGPAEPNLDVALDLTVSPTVPNPSVERLIVCKDGPAGTYSFTVTGPNDVGGAFDLDAGDCVQVLLRGGPGQTVTVTEDKNALPAGVAFSSVTATGIGPANTQTDQVNASASAVVGGAPTPSGAVFVFFNVASPTQGCTPGYWKQEHHFGSWTAPYDPDDLFSAHFEDAFPGMTLLDVLSNGGGGLDALGRHTVAALLNAANPNVNYGMTPAQVIAAFNAVFPGTKAQYNTLKDQFASANELGCSLGRADL